MTSPIFVLPEILCPILEWIRNDIESLHSCMFVNREWCRITAPILWRAPFKNRWLSKRASLISTSIRCLDIASKEKLKLFEHFPLEDLKVPTFNYVSFLHELQYPTLYDMVRHWCDEKGLRHYIEEDFYLFPIPTIVEMLIEQFMEKSKDLSKLSIPTVSPGEECIRLSKCCAAARSCLPKIRHFDCDDFIPGNLRLASELCTNLDRLDIDCSWGNDKEVSALIKAQKYLQHITVTKRWPNLNDAINENLRQSLKCVVLKDNRNYKDNGGPLSVLVSCKKLEILKFESWLPFEEEDMEDLASNHFPRLRTLSFTRCKLNADIIISMILVNGYNLRELKISWKTGEYDSFSIIRAIAGNCPNLKYLDVPITRRNLPYLLKCCKKLQNLTINFSSNETDYKVDDFLPTIGATIPESLYYLNIYTSWKFTAGSLCEFLNNCKNHLRRLGFYKSITDDHLKVIAKYAYERKSLNYLELRSCETSLEERIKARESINVIAVYNDSGKRIE